MITLVLGAPREFTASDVEYARSLVSDTRFQSLVQDTADAMVHDWSMATDLSAREAIWHRLQALRALLLQLEVREDHGLIADASGEAR